jgi:hypothetical protein
MTAKGEKLGHVIFELCSDIVPKTAENFRLSALVKRVSGTRVPPFTGSSRSSCARYDILIMPPLTPFSSMLLHLQTSPLASILSIV